MSDELKRYIREQAPGAPEDAVRDLEQIARELAPESTEEEFLAAFGFGVCARCGRKVDDDGFTDCELFPGDTVDDPSTVVCTICLDKKED